MGMAAGAMQRNLRLIYAHVHRKGPMRRTSFDYTGIGAQTDDGSGNEARFHSTRHGDEVVVHARGG
jgi:hypothetical protein